MVASGAVIGDKPNKTSKHSHYGDAVGNGIAVLMPARFDANRPKNKKPLREKGRRARSYQSGLSYDAGRARSAG